MCTFRKKLRRNDIAAGSFGDEAAVSSNDQSAADLSKCIEAVAASQDRASFTILFNYFVPRLKKYFCRRGVASDVADDLAQETMLKLWSKANRFDGAKGTPSPWVFAIARNLRITEVRKLLLVRTEIDISVLEDPAQKPDEAFVRSETEARLHQGLRGLPKAQAKLLHASFFDEKSHLEIAQELAMPLGTVKSHLRRTLIRLRTTLPETCET
jgi:RNA polymerase sigma-70 factor (ECF subfamily)